MRMARVHSFALRGKIGVNQHHSLLVSYYSPTSPDVDVLNYGRNDSLVFDTVGNCVLHLYSPEDMKLSAERRGSTAVEPRSSKGKKRFAESLPKTAPAPPKKRRLTIPDDEDSADEPLCYRSKALHLPDQSTEGWCFILPKATQN